MKHFTFVAIAVFALSAVALPSLASATTLEVGGVKKNQSIEIVATLAPGTSTYWESTGGAFVDTCTSSEAKAKTDWFTTGGTSAIGARVSTLTFSSCSHTTHVLKPGVIEVSWISGTTNGSVSMGQAELTAVSTVFGFSCPIQSNGGRIGTILGSKSGNATLLINGVFSSTCGDVVWAGQYTVTSPAGLGVAE